MMRRSVKTLAFLLIGVLAVSAVSCKLLHEKIVDIVIRNNACLDFEERHDTAEYVGTRQSFAIAFEVDKVLASLDPPLTRAQIDTARLTTASYEVTWLEDPGHDWTIAGRIMIGYDGDEEPIILYDAVSLRDALAEGAPTFPATFNEGGVDLFNRALDDYLANLDPVVDFWVEGEDCTPRPQDVGDSLKYDWTGCIYMYVVSPYRTEIVDFFGSD